MGSTVPNACALFSERGMPHHEVSSSAAGTPGGTVFFIKVQN